MLVIEWAELDRPDALHIPGVEEFVRADRLGTAWIAREDFGLDSDRRRIGVFESTAAAADEDVGVVLVGCGAENVDRGRRNAPQHVHEGGWGGGAAAGEIDDGAVRRAGGSERIGQEVAEQHG